MISLADATIAAQRTADPTAAAAEWDAEFRSDIGAFLDDELIDAAIELRLLERRTHRSGKDTVEHPRNGHDDHANVVCGVPSPMDMMRQG